MLLRELVTLSSMLIQGLLTQGLPVGVGLPTPPVPSKVLPLPSTPPVSSKVLPMPSTQGVSVAPNAATERVGSPIKPRPPAEPLDTKPPAEPEDPKP